MSNSVHNNIKQTDEDIEYSRMITRISRERAYQHKKIKDRQDKLYCAACLLALSMSISSLVVIFKILN
jgi:hypothetical protein